MLSITIDESRNVIDTTQLLLSVRGVNSDFEISEELACVHMSGAIKGGGGVENIVAEFNIVHIPCNRHIILDVAKLITHMVTNMQYTISYCRSRWPRCKMRGSGAASLLGLRVRVPSGAWMYVACVCCVLCKWRSLHRPDYSSRGVPPSGAYMNVIVKSPQ